MAKMIALFLSNNLMNVEPLNFVNNGSDRRCNITTSSTGEDCHKTKLQVVHTVSSNVMCHGL